VASWIELQGRQISAPTVKQQFAALRHLFDWLVTGQLMPVNPAASVRGPRHIVRTGKTLVLDAAKARLLLDGIDTTIPAGLRDRALISLMVYTFARVGAALGMEVEDVYTQNRWIWVRVQKKGGKEHALPSQPGGGSRGLRRGRRPDWRPEGAALSHHRPGYGAAHPPPLPQANVYSMIRRRAETAGIKTKIGNHSFRATGITAYLKNGGTLEMAASMANHASTRTTQLYNRPHEEPSLEEVERILI